MAGLGGICDHPRMTSPGDLEPDQLIAREVRSWTTGALRRLRDLVHGWAGSKMLAWIVAAGLAVWAGVASSLSLVFVILGAGLLLVAGGLLIAGRRLLQGERSRRRWAQVNALRADQGRLRAEQQLIAAALAISGHRDPGAHHHPDVRVAIADARQRASADAPERARARRGRVDGLLARSEQLAAERAACEAEIQALASPGDPAAGDKARTARQAAADARTAARRADAAARERRRRGQSATTPPADAGFRMTINLDGSRSVEGMAPEQTPEQIAGVRPRGSTAKR